MWRFYEDEEEAELIYGEKHRNSGGLSWDLSGEECKENLGGDMYLSWSWSNVRLKQFFKIWETICEIFHLVYRKYMHFIVCEFYLKNRTKNNFELRYIINVWKFNYIIKFTLKCIRKMDRWLAGWISKWLHLMLTMTESKWFMGGYIFPAFLYFDNFHNS